MHLFPLLLLAAAFWGQTPACGQPSIEPAALPAPLVGLANLADCSIVVDPKRLTFAGAACMVVVHEYKHLLGYYNPTGFTLPDGDVDHNHSPDPTDLMYPVMGKPVWPCAW
jgi:hypothetical protein